MKGESECEKQAEEMESIGERKKEIRRTIFYSSNVFQSNNFKTLNIIAPIAISDSVINESLVSIFRNCAN